MSARSGCCATWCATDWRPRPARRCGRLAFLAARTVTAPPGRDMANSATSPILQQRQPKLQVGGVAYRCPIEFRHQVGTLGRPTWRTTAPGGRTLFWTLVPRRPIHRPTFDPELRAT